MASFALLVFCTLVCLTALVSQSDAVHAVLNEGHHLVMNRGSRLGPQDTSKIPEWTPLANGSISMLRGGQHLWSSKHKYFACLVPKCGSAHWLMSVFNQHLSPSVVKDIESDGGVHAKQSYPDDGLFFAYVGAHNQDFSDADIHNGEREMQAFMNNDEYFKFAIVRHPWTRFVSGYRSKYLGKCNGKRKLFSEKFNIPLDLSSKRDVVTLDEVLEGLMKVPFDEMNYHFRPATVLCEMSRVPYNFIADLDTAEDIEVITKRTGLPPPLPEYGFEERKTPCTARTVELAARLYQADLEAFGYTMRQALLDCHEKGYTL